MENIRLTSHLKVSVVIPALDEEQEIGQCLASLARQTFGDFVVIVVDNGSKDATVSIARTFGALVVHEPRQGVSYARETGFHAARSDIIVSTDADTEVPQNWLQRIHRTFVEDPNAVAVFGPYWYKPFFPRSGLASALIPHLSRALMFGQRMSWRFGHPYFSAANFAVRREAFLKAGGFRSSKDGQIYSDWEDVQLGIKLHRIGKVCYLPDLVVLTSARNLKLDNARDILFGTPKKALRVQVMGKDL